VENILIAPRRELNKSKRKRNFFTVENENYFSFCQWGWGGVFTCYFLMLKEPQPELSTCKKDFSTKMLK
jgi:hypothetical protein